MHKKTKIVCTIGPATESKEKLEALLNAGMNVMRLNFSHGNFTEHQNRIDNLKAAIKKTKIPAAILQDFSGPKIRIGEFKTDHVTLKEGEKFILTTRQIMGDEKCVSINYPLLPKEVKKGEVIYLHDGKKKLVVTDIVGTDVITEVVVGGEIKGRRGVNLPDSDISICALTEKDRKDLDFGFKNDVDFFALSFVRKPEDVRELRKIILKKKSMAKIIAKIETPQSLEAIDCIIAEADGIMIARGDLAIEIPAENVPLVQKMIIKKCGLSGKPVITATQMLESMIKNPVPTRAEVSDVANAIIDGTDAVMLSEETTLGEYPVKADEVMSRIALKVENDVLHDALSKSLQSKDVEGIAHSVTLSAVRTAERTGVKFYCIHYRTGKERSYGIESQTPSIDTRLHSERKNFQSIFAFLWLLSGTYEVVQQSSGNAWFYPRLLP